MARVVADQFGLTRQAASSHLRRMVRDGVLESSGNTRSRLLRQNWSPQVVTEFRIEPSLAEDRVWSEAVVPRLPDMASNTRQVVAYCVNEMANNAIEHSEGARLWVGISVSPGWVQLAVVDDGVGIFRKIQRALDLPTAADVVLELRKGKLTTDPSAHTGEGIFFTSRLCDAFSIDSAPIVWRSGQQSRDIVLESPGQRQGTAVSMELLTDGDRTLDDVFERFSDDFQFNKTEVPLLVATLGSDEYLVSRSAARRVVSRLERFRQVMLDFDGVATIGQAFADEIFRVFASSHPESSLVPINMTRAVARMVDRARQSRLDQDHSEVGRPS